MINRLGALFGAKPALREGDYFFVKDSGKYQSYKVLRKQEDVLHVLTFEACAKPPEIANKDTLDVLIWHSPIAETGFTKPTVFGNSIVRLEELQGYHVYLQEIGWVEGQVEEAQAMYHIALSLHDRGQFQRAINYYTAAADIFPKFFEATDNKGFCHMSLAQWEAAVECFKTSLTENSHGVTAIFSLGECYMRLEDYQAARLQFEQAAELDPNNGDIQYFAELAAEKRPHPDWVKRRN